MTTFARSFVAGSACLCVAALLASCSSTPMLKTGDVQKTISVGLTEQAGGSFDVVCPSAAPAEKGFVFSCSVSDATDGSTHTVIVTQVDDAGSFTWRVDDPSQAAPSPSGTGT